MDVNEAIRTRRTIAKFTDDPVSVDTLVGLLSAGIWAPNHRLTEPWRFVILGPETRRELAGRFADLKANKVPAEDVARWARIRAEHERKFQSIPAIVAVAAANGADEIGRREDFAATACAIQNIQLTAWAEGIGVKWSTSGLIRDPLAYDLLDINPTQFEIIGFLFIGYPAEIPVRDRKRPLSEVIWQTP
ncbi:MAG: nitroreductase [Candidatus Promineofilum sp.]|nr:nitroreductase [Promineifilum sp.]